MSVVIPRQQRRPYGFDDPFFGDLFGRQETRPYVLDCNQLIVEARPVPMVGRPDAFTGGVGVFDFDVEIGPTEVKAGEPITVRMRVAGAGNLSKITPPMIDASHEFKLYDARTVPTGDPNAVQFEQVIIPKSGSVSNIPEIAFAYFNTKTADFRVIKQGPFPVTVEDAPQQTAQVIATVPSTIQQETQVLGRDIVYLKSAPKTWTKETDTPPLESTLFRILLALPGLLLVLVAAATARRDLLANNVALARRQQAPKATRKTVQRAERALRAGDAAAFNEALWDALVAYFGHRLNLAPGEVSLPVVLNRVPAEHDAIRALFDAVEQRRYGVQSDADESKADMKALLRELTATLKKCERMKL